MSFRVAFHRLGLAWYSLRDYDSIPLRVWLYSSAHDETSYFWRILGLEVNWIRGDF